MVASAAVTIASAFGLPTNAKDVAALIQNFDFSKINVSDARQSEYLNFNLAPSFGTLTSESVKLMDEKLKIIISGTTRAIAKLQDKSWANVLSALSQNPLLEPLDTGLERSDKLIKDFGTSAFKFDGSADTGVVREVETWFRNFIGGTCTLHSEGFLFGVRHKKGSGPHLDAPFTTNTCSNYVPFFDKQTRTSSILLALTSTSLPRLLREQELLWTPLSHSLPRTNTMSRR